MEGNTSATENKLITRHWSMNRDQQDEEKHFKPTIHVPTEDEATVAEMKASKQLIT